jgi:hypothetical protein
MANYQRGNASNIVVGAAAIFVGGITNLVTTLDYNETLQSPGFDTAKVPAFQPGQSYKDTLANANTWRNIGYTNNGLELAFNPTFGDVTVDQLLDVAKLFKSGMQVTLKTSLAEATLENLLFALAQRGSVNRYAGSVSDTVLATVTYTPATGTATGIYTPVATTTQTATDQFIDLFAGDLGDYPVERSLIAVGASTVGTAAQTNSGAPSITDQTERVYFAYRVVNISNVTVSAKRDTATMFDVEFRLLPDSNGAYGKIVDRTY